MADSIKITFLPETVSESIVFYNTGDPSFSEIKSFFQEITHVLTPEEAESDDFLITAPHHKVIVKGYYETDESEEVEAEYFVADTSQVGGNLTQIVITNDWTADLDETPPEDLIRLQIIMQPESNGLDGELTISQASPDVTKFEMTFFKDGNSKTVPEPEVYPSVARSLDKLVDKMEGNTVKVPGDPKVFETGFSYIKMYDKDGQSIVNLTGTLDDLPEWTEERCMVQLLHSGEVIASQSMLLMTEYVPIGSDDVEYAVKEYFWGTLSETNYFKIILSVLDEDGNAPNYLSTQYQKRVIMAHGICLAFFKDLPPSDKASSHPDDYTIRFVGSAVLKTVPAYETYKEAVPSVERSMWKIAELYGANKDSITLGNTTLTESDLAKLLSIINDEDEGASSGGDVPPAV